MTNPRPKINSRMTPTKINASIGPSPSGLLSFSGNLVVVESGSLKVELAGLVENSVVVSVVV